MDEILRLSDIDPEPRCPMCGSRKLESISSAQDEMSTNGTALWSITQRCIVCGWFVSYEHVKLGA